MRRRAFVKTASVSLALPGLLQPARAQSALEPIRLIAIASDALAPLYYGLKIGLFKKAGIDLQIFRAASGTAATAAVVGGDYDISNTSILPVMNAHMHSVPIAIVAPQGIYTPANPFSLLQKAADSQYRTGLDLNGQTMAVSALNDISQLSIAAWVDKNGGDSTTLKFVEIPNSAMDTAIVEHRVAGALLLEPMLSESLSAGRTKTLGDAYGAIGPRFMFAAYVARTDWASQHADRLRRFVSAALTAASYTNSHQAETAQMMADVTKVPLAVVQRMRRVVCATAVEPTLVQPVIDVAARYKMIPKAFPAEDMFFLSKP